MTLDFEKYDYKLYQDWQKNTVKDSFTTELKKRSEKEEKNEPIERFEYLSIFISDTPCYWDYFCWFLHIYLFYYGFAPLRYTTKNNLIKTRF